MMISTTRGPGRLAPVILVCSLMASGWLAGPAAGQVADGLTAYWPMDDSLEDALDLPGDGSYDGIMQGADFTEFYSPGKFGSGIDLQGGLDQRVEIGDFINEGDFDFAGGSVSISAWFSVTSFTKGWQALVAKGEGSGWRIARRGGASNIMAYAGGTGDIPTDDVTGPNVNDGAFHHVVAISEAGVSTRLWVDGELVATGGAPVLEDRANPMQIGGNPDAAGRTWDGVIDDVAIWNRPLTETEIAAIWNAGVGIPVGNLLDPDDTDGDGMPNFWETANGTNPNVADDQEDPDGDGLVNIDEFNRGTNPQVADTDGDGLVDGVETGTGIFVDATDTGTDPVKPDTDGDGFSDGVEDGGGTFVDENQTGTNPNLADTDEDGFTDFAEVVFGSDPNDGGDGIAGIAELPFLEPFDDPIVNPAIWRIDTTIPQGGASVTVADGQAVLAQRGHLVTVDQFDPETTNGVLVSGEWTFANIVDIDFLQILLRSDGVPDPANCCGETRSGIEFRFSTDQTTPTIGARGVDLVVTPGTTTGSISVVSGTVVAFEIVDTGAGDLSITMTEVGNPANTATATATVDLDFSDTNHIVFHNREASGRTAFLDNVLITTLSDSDGDGMPDTWENANGLDPNDPSDADQGADDGMFDNDGLTNLEEFQRGSDPNKADTDDDGLPDLVETGTGVWVSPADTGTRPANPDTDGDGALDGVETNTGIFVSATDLGSDPHDPDTDLDGYVDGEEARFGTDPNDPDSVPDFRTGVVGYWKLDDNLLEEVGPDGAYDGTLEGIDATATYVDGVFGRAIELQGPSDQRIVVGTPANENDFDFAGRDVSISAWFRVNSFTKGWQALVAKGEGSGWRIARRGDASNIMAYAGGSGDIPTDDLTGPDVNDGAWHHVVAVSEGGFETRLYVDGQLVATGAPPTLENRANRMMIGGNPDTGPGFRTWDGAIDDVGVWAVPLTDDDVQVLWNGGTGTSIAEVIGVGAGPLQVTDITYDTDTFVVDLTWTSRPGKSYAIFASLDLQNWDLEITDGVASAGEVTSFSFENPFPDLEKVYFRVEEL